MDGEARSRLFISYRRGVSSKFSRAVLSFMRRLVVESVFFDDQSIRGGDEWRLKIDDALQDTACMIVVIGPGWDLSFNDRDVGGRDWVKYEIQQALDDEIPIVPVLHGGCSLTKEGLPISIQSVADRQGIDVVGMDDRAGFARLLTELRKRLVLRLRRPEDDDVDAALRALLRRSQRDVLAWQARHEREGLVLGCWPDQTVGRGVTVFAGPPGAGREEFRLSGTFSGSPAGEFGVESGDWGQFERVLG